MIRTLAAPGVDDPWADATTLTQAVRDGLLDAPQSANHKFGRGRIRTQIVNGACETVDEEEKVVSESAPSLMAVGEETD